MSLQTKFSIRWRALYISRSKSRGVLRPLLDGITGVLPAASRGFDHSRIGVERFIGQQGIGPHLRQEHIGALKVMRLTAGQEEGKWIAQRIDHKMDLCAQPAFAAPDRLVFTLFFWAPALCWWARTIVLSIMAYSLSASAAKISNIFFQTSLLAHRENRV